MDAERTPDFGIFDFKFHQVAMYTTNIRRAVDLYSVLGYSDWTYDEATLVGTLLGKPIKTQAKMAFNYQIMPLELEFLTYSGPSRHEHRIFDAPFISHLSVHVVDGDAICEAMLSEFGLRPFHEFETHDHINPKIRGVKRFREFIFDTTSTLGHDLKLIERIPWGDG